MGRIAPTERIIVATTNSQGDRHGPCQNRGETGKGFQHDVIIKLIYYIKDRNATNPGMNIIFFIEATKGPITGY
jgi:hypothetical protein